MKIAIAKKLTLAHVQKQGRLVFFATATAILVMTISVLWMLFHIGGERVTILFADAGYATTAFIGASWVFYVVHQMRKGPLLLEKRYHQAWLLIGLGLVSSGIGGAYYTYLEYMGRSPFPSYSDIFFNLFYPLVGIGLILMPTTLRFRVRMAFDAGITTLALMGASWFFLIGPLYLAQRDQVSALELITALSYPAWDLFLVLAIVLLIQRRTDPLLHSSLILFAIGIIADIWADSGYAYLNVFGNYQSGTFYIDPFWFVGFLFAGLAALYQYHTFVRRAYQEHAAYLHSPRSGEEKAEPRSFWSNNWSRLQNNLIFVPLLLLLSLTFYSEFYMHNTVEHWLVFITVCTGLLVVVRFQLALHENTVLHQERQRQHTLSEQLRRLSTQLTAILAREPLCERIVVAAVAELEFNVALLLLCDLPYYGPSAHARITAYNVSAQTPLQVQHWPLQAESNLQHLALAGKETEILWQDIVGEENNLHPSPQSVQNTLMYFLPLCYQNKIWGCLGVTSRYSACLSKDEYALFQLYAEQVTTVIEHASLYQEKHEHEMFARALADLATRLNTAMVEPTEVHHIICQEATNALRADYCLLYVAGTNRDLLPLATYGESQDVVAANLPWPPIRAHEQEAQALFSLQPILVQLPPASGRITEPLRAASPLPSSIRPTTQTRLPALSNQYLHSLREQLQLRDVHSLLLTPLIARGKPIALLLLARSHHNGEKKAFEFADITAMQDFAEQAAVAFMNAQLYQELRNAHQQLQELDHLKDQFMITASHELRTPLTSVQGYLELLAQYGENLPLENRQEFLHNARRGCDELVVMLTNIMDASRLEVDAGIRPALLQRVVVQSAIDEILDLLKPQIVQEQREVYMHIPSSLTVQADPLRLRQVLLNISTNALKYSSPTSPLLYAAHSTIQQPPATIISISDKGQGIPPQLQRQLFQKFARLERDLNSPIRGSGLGLYISRRLVEAMGGKLWVESSGVAGEGSTFYIQLPTIPSTLPTS